MTRVVVMGAGVSGHTAAMYLRKDLGKEHDVVVVTPNSQWNWIPSNIWVGVGKMKAKDVLFPLAPIYRKAGIDYRQAKAVTIWPEGDGDDATPGVEIEYTSPDRAGEREIVRYDWLINATGPKLNFAATEGLGPDGGHSLSVCTADHAVHTAGEFAKAIERCKAGEKLTFVVGTGHGTCTCEGAAFEYVFNVEHELRQAGVRDNAEVYYLTNEADLGDFGVDGMTFTQQGFQTSSKTWTESLLRERGVHAIVGAHVEKVEPGKVSYEQLDGSRHTLDFDFAMLLPPFTGVGIDAKAADGADITEQLFAPNKLMKVDADYTPKPYADWRAGDWPQNYRSPVYHNIFAVGIAFAPPHPISEPRQSANGTNITPSPPRTGMPSGIMGRVVAETIIDQITKGPGAELHEASMSAMGAACVASAGNGLFIGSAAAMTMFPVVPDYQKYPTGRSIKDTSGEIGLAGHWIKLMLHYLFIYKAKARPLWFLIPE